MLERVSAEAAKEDREAILFFFKQLTKLPLRYIETLLPAAGLS